MSNYLPTTIMNLLYLGVDASSIIRFRGVVTLSDYPTSPVELERGLGLGTGQCFTWLRTAPRVFFGIITTAADYLLVEAVAEDFD